MLQEDLIEIYNSLVVFSKDIINNPRPKPIKVYYEKESRLLVFEEGGNSVRLWTPIYYVLGLDDLVKPTYLLPEGYDYLMSELKNVIISNSVRKAVTTMLAQLSKGLLMIQLFNTFILDNNRASI